MVYDVNSFRATIYRSGNYDGRSDNAPGTDLAIGGPLKPDKTDQHGMVAAGKRATAKDIVHPDQAGKLVKFTDPTGAGDCVFLPFFQNNICSAVVPAAAVGVENFFTAEMSGCAIYIDRVTAVPPPMGPPPPQIAVGDLIVYHANAMNRCATQTMILNNPAAAANIAARNYMRDTLHPAAAGDYNARGYTLQLNVGVCEQAVYMNAVNKELDRKRAMGRTKVRFTGGTNVMGFRVSGQWQFWFQTWGWVTYVRPIPSAKMHKGLTKEAEGPPRIWDVGRIL